MYIMCNIQSSINTTSPQQDKPLRTLPSGYCSLLKGHFKPLDLLDHCCGSGLEQFAELPVRTTLFPVYSFQVVEFACRHKHVIIFGWVFPRSFNIASLIWQFPTRGEQYGVTATADKQSDMTLYMLVG